jgi:hypothetical protein
MPFDPMSAGLAGGSIISGAVGNIFGNKSANSGLDEAMKLLKEYYGMSIDEIMAAHKYSKKMYGQIEGLYSPYKKYGDEILKKYMSTLEMPPEGSPLYQWRLKQGREDIDRSAASGGLYNSSFRDRSRQDLSSRLTGEETDKLYQRLQSALQLVGQYGTQGMVGAKEGVMGSRWKKSGYLADTYKELGGALAGMTAQQGANTGGLYSSLGAMPGQGVGMYDILNKGR